MKQNILQELRRGGKLGVDAGRLAAITTNYTSVISNLRRDGHVIVRDKERDGSVRYTLERDACVCKRRGCGEKMPKPSRTGLCGFCIEEKAKGLRPHERLAYADEPEKVAAA